MTRLLIVKKVCNRVKKKKKEKEKEGEQFTTLTLFWPRATIPKLPSTDLSNHDTFISSL